MSGEINVKNNYQVFGMSSWYRVQDEENVHKCRFGKEEYKKFSFGGIKCKMPIRGIFKKPSKSGSCIYIS